PTIFQTSGDGKNTDSVNEETSLTIKQIPKDSQISNTSLIFKVYPFPFPFDFGYTSIMLQDNDGVFDSDPIVGKVKLNGIKFEKYEIQQLTPTSTGCF